MGEIARLGRVVRWMVADEARGRWMVADEGRGRRRMEDEPAEGGWRTGRRKAAGAQISYFSADLS